MALIPLAAVVLWSLLWCTEAAVKPDLVTDLPGLTFKPSFKHYSGYLKATGTRKLHYWLVTSSMGGTAAPLVLWMNGGPGCSSLDGLLSEHGPFRVSKDGKTITENIASWNRLANMLYLEAPAGVGYSYADDHNYTTGDNQVALDNYWALKNFFMKYPEYSKNDFFITGESYGGIYVPTLAARVMDDSKIQFKGFAVGNGLADYNLNGNSLIYFGYYHGLWGTKLWNAMVSQCCDDNYQDNTCDFVSNSNPSCQNLVNEARSTMNMLNIYNLYAECYTGPSNSNSTKLNWLFDPRFSMLSKPDPKIFRTLSLQSMKNIGVVPPCIDARGATIYLNRADVRKTLHIPSQLPEWAICSTEVGAKYVREYTTVKDIYLKVLASKKYRIMVYNGDVDMACNFLGDQWFVQSLKQKLVKPWRSWSYSAKDGSKQVAGFIEEYENISFVTVKGAGHMVPQDKPIPAVTMFQQFISNAPFE